MTDLEAHIENLVIRAGIVSLVVIGAALFHSILELYRHG